MTEDLKELYQEVIMDHNKSPRNFRVMEGADCSAEGYNPMCGDHVVIYVKFQDGVIQDITFQGVGCALSKASASLMTGELKGRTYGEAIKLFESVHDMLISDSAPEDIGKMAVLSGVHQFPMRVKCVTLAWHAMRDALCQIHS